MLYCSQPLFIHFIHLIILIIVIYFSPYIISNLFATCAYVLYSSLLLISFWSSYFQGHSSFPLSYISFLARVKMFWIKKKWPSNFITIIDSVVPRGHMQSPKRSSVPFCLEQPTISLPAKSFPISLPSRLFSSNASLGLMFLVTYTILISNFQFLLLSVFELVNIWLYKNFDKWCS